MEDLLIYPASEMVLSEERLSGGLKAITKEHKAFAAKLKAEHKTESYARINREIARMKEALTEFHGAMGVDSLIEYFYENTVSFLDYFREASMVFIDDNAKVKERAKQCYQEFAGSMESRLEGGYILPGQAGVLFDAAQIYEKLEKMQHTVQFSLLQRDSGYLPGTVCYPFLMKSMASYDGRLPDLIRDMKKWRDGDYRQMVISPSATRGRRLADNFEREGIIAFFSQDKKRILAPREVMVTTGHLQTGFILEQAKLIVIRDRKSVV